MRYLFTFAVLLVSGCTVPSLQLEGLACDEQDRCLEGYVCVDGRCLGAAAADAGGVPDAGSPDAGELPCELGDTRACGSNVGTCVPGTQTCGEQGTWGDCEGEVGPIAETCDGEDNDCDGSADEELDGDHDGWGRDGVTCTMGSDDCDDTDPDVHPGATEACNGLDDDCDSARDETFGCVLDHVGGACTTTCGTIGVEACASDCSGTVCALPAETCNDRDDDCDSNPDDGLNSGQVVVGDAAARPAIAAVGSSLGGYLVAWPQKDAATASLGFVRVGRNALPGTVATLATGEAARLPALTEKHLAWVETSQGNDVVRFVELAGEQLGATTRTLVSTAAEIDSLHAVRSGEESLVAVGYAAQNHVEIYRLGSASGLLQDVPAVGQLGSPVLGTIGGARTLYAELGASASRTSTLVVYQESGEVFRFPSQSIPSQAAAAAEAVAFRSETTCASCPGGKGAQVRLMRMLSGGAPGPAIELSPSEAVAEQPRIAVLGNGTYLVAWLDASASPKRLNLVRVAWDGSASAWMTPSFPTPLTVPGRSLNWTAVAADSASFLAAFDASDASENHELFVRASCP